MQVFTVLLWHAVDYKINLKRHLCILYNDNVFYFKGTYEKVTVVMFNKCKTIICKLRFVKK